MPAVADRQLYFAGLLRKAASLWLPFDRKRVSRPRTLRRVHGLKEIAPRLKGPSFAKASCVSPSSHRAALLTDHPQNMSLNSYINSTYTQPRAKLPINHFPTVTLGLPLRRLSYKSLIQCFSNRAYPRHNRRRPHSHRQPPLLRPSHQPRPDLHDRTHDPQRRR